MLRPLKTRHLFGKEEIATLAGYYRDSEDYGNEGWGGTYYCGALELIDDKLEELNSGSNTRYNQNQNIVLFFSDGEPTNNGNIWPWYFNIDRAFSLVSGDSKENAVFDRVKLNYNVFDDDGVTINKNETRAEYTTNGKEIWFEKDNAITKLGPKIIRNAKTRMCFVYFPSGYGTSTYGFKKYLTTSGITDENKSNPDFYEGENIATLFDSVYNSTFNKIEDGTKNSEYGVVNLAQKDNIYQIDVGTTSYTGDNLTIIKSFIDANGNINLSNVKIGENYIFRTAEAITIHYK